jgi:serine/threonine protein kinase
MTRKPAREIAEDGLMRASASGDMLSALVVGREEPGFPRGFGKYQLLERVGTGGMAEVFRAVVRGAEGFEKEVCIKRILPMFTEDEDFVRMFIDEAALASKLHHANIVQTLDFDKIDGQYYIALEFVEGRDLKRVLSALRQSARPIPITVGAFIGAEILKGLHFAHARRHSGQALGVVHRDISPHNVLVSMSGEVKITDFGIAKAASRVSATRSGVVKGKILYMSPEQAGGGTIDHRADLFAAGVVLYEALTGQRPFAADTDAESLAKIARGDFKPPRTVRPELSERLDAVVCKLMAKSPGERYASGGEALRDLGPEVPTDGAMLLGELMSALIEGPVPISRRAVTEILDIEKAKPVAFEPAVIPADSAAVTRTRGPREAPEAIAFLDTQVATPSVRSAERPSLGSDIQPSVPTVITGPPEDMLHDADTAIPATAVHHEPAPRQPSLPPTNAVTAPETPRAKPAVPPAPDGTPAAWSFSAEAPGSMRRSRRLDAPSVAAAVAVVVALTVGGTLALTSGRQDATPELAPSLPPLMPALSPPFAPPPVSAAAPMPPPAPAPPPALGVAVPAAVSKAVAPAKSSPRSAARTRTAPAVDPRAVAAAVERTQPAPAPTPAFGTLIINAQPWARVKVNGRALGETPVGPVRVPAGTVRIVLEREGRPPLTRTITLAPGEDRSLSVPFP